MSDFFTRLKKSLDGLPETSSTDADWIRMQAKLNSANKNNPARRFPLGLWLVLPLAILLMLNGYLFNRLNQIDQQNGMILIQKDTLFLQQEKHTSDTVFLTKVIYKTRYLTEPMSMSTSDLGQKYRTPFFSGPLAFPSFYKNINPVNDPNNDNVLWNNNNSPHLKITEVGHHPKAEWQHANESIHQLDDAFFALENLPTPQLFPATFQKDLPLLDYELLDISPSKNFRTQVVKLSRGFWPRRFELGFQGGKIFPMQEGLEFQNGYRFGLHAAMELSNHFKVWLNGSLIKLAAESDRMDPAMGIPVVDSPNTEFTFQSVEIQTASYQYSIGLDRMFNYQGKLRPFVGVGYGIASPRPYELDYEFVNTNNPASEPKLIVERDIRPDNLLPGIFLIRTGFDYQVVQRFSISVLGSYQTTANNHQLSAPRMLNLQLGTFYHF